MNRDGLVDALDVAAVSACLGTDVGVVLGCRDADIDIDGRVEQDDLDFFVTEGPVDFPPLVASEPVAEAVQVPRTAWIRLDFSETWKKRAPGSLTLDCAGESQAFHVARLSATQLVVNPDADLPPGAPCHLAWTGPGGATESLAFGVAAAGPAASVLYDRRDASLLPPFPDDYWLTPDAATATGQRVRIEVPERDDDVVQLFGALTTDTGVLDGFSPLAMIAVEVSDAPDPASLPLTVAQSLDPLASVGLFDLTPASPDYGSRVPFQLHVRNDALGDQPVAHSLVAFPSIPLTPGGRYAFVVTRRALVDATRPFDASAFLQAALAPAVGDEAPAVAAVRGVLAPVVEQLAHASPPLRADDVALALRITVRSTSTLSDDLLAMKQQVLAESPPTLKISSTQAASGGGAVVRGTFQAPDWRQGHFLARDASGAPRITRRNAVPFVLALPAAAESAAVPVVMYQHGNPGTAEDAYTDPYHLRARRFRGRRLHGHAEPRVRGYRPTDVRDLRRAALLRACARPLDPDLRRAVCIPARARDARDARLPADRGEGRCARTRSRASALLSGCQLRRESRAGVPSVRTRDPRRGSGGWRLAARRTALPPERDGSARSRRDPRPGRGADSERPRARGVGRPLDLPDDLRRAGSAEPVVAALPRSRSRSQGRRARRACSPSRAFATASSRATARARLPGSPACRSWHRCRKRFPRSSPRAVRCAPTSTPTRPAPSSSTRAHTPGATGTTARRRIRGCSSSHSSSPPSKPARRRSPPPISIRMATG